MVKTILFSFLFLLINCNSDQYDQDKCQQLLFDSYKGQPVAANSFNKNCSNIELKYSRATCQRAFTDLSQFKGEAYLQKTYGPEVMNCFTKKDIKIFLGK